MPDASQQINELKGLPDQALQFELSNPSGAVPAYLVLAEAQRRQLMRQAAQTQQNQAPVGSVYDDVIRSMMARQPPPGIGPAGMTPPPAAPPAAPQTPQNFRPPARMAEGGEVDDSSDDGDTGGMVEMPLKFNLDDAINQVAYEHGRDPNELRAIVQTESRGNPNVVSPKGATGLMQLMPATGRQYGAHNLKDPWQSLEAGASFLDHLDDKYNYDPTLVHAAYNAGEGNVDKYGGMPPFKETRNYVQKVARLQDQAAQVSAQGSAARAVESEVPPPQQLQSDNVIADPQTAGPYVNPRAAAPPPTSGLTYSGLGSLEAPEAPAGEAEEPEDVEIPGADQHIGMPGADIGGFTNTASLGGGTAAAPVTPAPTSTKAATDAFSDLRDKVQKMWDEAEAMKHPTRKQLLFRMLENFGAGMAQTPARTWGGALAGGMSGMSKGFQTDADTAREQQLKLMGVSAEIDKAMSQNQVEAARIHATAVNEAAKSHDEMWAKDPDSVLGTKDKSPGGQYAAFEPSMLNPGQGWWHLGATMPVTAQNQKYLKDANGNPLAIGTNLPRPLVRKADTLVDNDQKERDKAAATSQYKTLPVADQDRQNNAHNWAINHTRAPGQEPWDFKNPAHLYQQTQEDPNISPADKQKIALSAEQTATGTRADQAHADLLAHQDQERKDQLARQASEDAWRRQTHSDSLAHLAATEAQTRATHADTLENQLMTARTQLSNGISKQYWTPADNVVNRTNTILHNLEYGKLNGDEVTDSLLAPQLLVAEVGGQGSGVRITRAEIENVLHGRSTLENLQMAWKKALTGAQLSDAQRDQIRDLVNYIHLKAKAKLDSADYWDQQLGAAGSRKDQLDMMNRIKREQADLDEHPFAARDEQGNLHSFSSQGGLQQYMAQPHPAAAPAPAPAATPPAAAPPAQGGAKPPKPAMPAPAGRVWMYHPSAGWKTMPADKVKDKQAIGWSTQ